MNDQDLPPPVLMNWGWVQEYAGLFLDGLINTIILLLISGMLGSILAVLVGFGLVTGPRLLRLVLKAFTTTIRGTPLLVQLFFFYFGVGQLIDLRAFERGSLIREILASPFFYAIIAFTISTAAYSGEILRGALRSVPDGELEAARAYGMGRFQILRRIWLPRAIQISLPTLSGEMILLLKSVPLVSLITILDLKGAADRVYDIDAIRFEPLILAALVYVLIALVLGTIMRQIEVNFPGRRPANV